jgi:hypothetical protein
MLNVGPAAAWDIKGKGSDRRSEVWVEEIEKE